MLDIGLRGRRVLREPLGNGGPLVSVTSNNQSGECDLLSNRAHVIMRGLRQPRLQQRRVDVVEHAGELQLEPTQVVLRTWSNFFASGTIADLS